MLNYRYGWIEISHNLFELDFLLLSVYAVLFYPAVFEMCGLRTDNHSGTRIGKRPYFALTILCLNRSFAAKKNSSTH